MIQLQSILFPSHEVCEVPELYYHDYGTDGKQIDFDGYFNLFYIEKRKAYTAIENLYLDIELEGYKELHIIHNGEKLQTVSLDETVRKSYHISFPYKAYGQGVFWFALTKGTREKTFVSGFYTADVPEKDLRSVGIGVDICTYRREPCVERNLRQLQVRILNAGLQVSEHVGIYVSDNGKTLADCEPVQNIVKSSGGKIHIFPNMNAGGAGGFTRGMLEILQRKEQENLTHVLIMDDDAILEPDAILRIYGFLSTVKEEWKDITLGGAMLREDYPYMLFCAGERWQNGAIYNPEMHLDLRDRATASNVYLTETGHEHEWYSGWWCCSYSLNTVRADNLPVPVFIHHDDIEYGLRNKNCGIVFLNGVGVWHRGAEKNFPGSNIYYDVRNNLILIALYQQKNQKKTAFKLLLRAMVLAAVRMKYSDAEMVYKGFCDYLKGPEWLQQSNPEILHANIRAMACTMQPLDDLKRELTSDEMQQVQNQIDQYEKAFDLTYLLDAYRTKRSIPKKQMLSLNGWFLPAKKGVVKVVFPTDSPFVTYRIRKAVLYEPGSRKAAVLKKSYRNLFHIIRKLMDMLILLNREYDKSVADYKGSISMITNQKAWEEYLKLR